MRAGLQHLIPQDKFDIAAAEMAVATGWPAIEPVAAELLDCVQDLNWPVARVLAPLLASAGAGLAPQILRILRTDDETWKWSVIQGVVKPSKPLSRTLQVELRRMAERPTASEHQEELDLLAREALQAL